MAAPMRRFLDSFDRQSSRGDLTLSVSPPPRNHRSAGSETSRSPNRGLEARGGSSFASLSALDASPIVASSPSTHVFGRDRSQGASRTMREAGANFMRLGSTALRDASPQDEVDGEAFGLRGGLEDLRSSVRELQKQQRQAARSWRTELEASLEAALESVQTKISDSQRDALDVLGRELRSEFDKTSRNAAKRCTALEDAMEASKKSSESAALRAELAGVVQALAKTGSEDAGAVTKAYADAHVEARLAILEQQIAALNATTSAASDVAVRPSNSKMEAAERKAEAAEQRGFELEAKLKEQCGNLGEQLRSLKQAFEADVAHTTMRKLEQNMEELREHSGDGFRASAQSLASLE
ncbi:unnamed protein product, partial [Polarella glacialis]